MKRNIFHYVLDLSKIEHDERGMNLLRERFGAEVQNFDTDTRHVHPEATLVTLKYKENFVALAKIFDINIEAPRYFNSYHTHDEFTFKDDKSCLNAMHLSELSIFKPYFKVTRTGISFTWAGANQYWREVSQDVSKRLGIEFRCKQEKQ